MRVKSATERYRAVNEGTMSKQEFVRQMRQQYPMHITQFNGYDDSVQILKNRGLLFEEKKEVIESSVYDERPALNYSLDALDRGIRIEIQTLGLEPGSVISAEQFKKAEKKAKTNLEKNPTHYLDLISGESKKVDKHDKPVVVKRGKGEVDVFNGLKKAALKEGYTEEQIGAAIEKIKERKMTEEVPTQKTSDEKREALMNAVDIIQGKYRRINGINGLIKDFLSVHTQDIVDGADPLEEFDNFVSVNYDSLNEGRKKRSQGGKVVTENDYDTGGYVESMGPRFDAAVEKLVDAFEEWKAGPMTEPGMIPYAKEDVLSYIGGFLDDSTLEEKKGKDLDDDGDVDSDDYLAAKDQAIQAAMNEESQIKEAVKSIIRKVLIQESINEAATGNLSSFSDEYQDFAGMTQIINQLENIVTEVEGFYAKTSEKLQKVFDAMGNITNEEGLKVGGFIAPSIEAAFRKDIQPVIKKGFMNGVETPKVRTISQADIDGHNSGERPLGEEEKQTMFTPVYENKKK